MIESGAQKPLGKGEPFRMNREDIAVIQEGDLVESRFRTVTFVDEEKRAQLLKGLDKESRSARREIGTMRLGMSIDEAGIKILEDRYGPFFQSEKEKCRVLYSFPHTDGSVWVGPPELTVEDVAAFKQELHSGQRSERFAKCRQAYRDEFRRVLDS